jgi:hypothetical protein
MAEESETLMVDQQKLHNLKNIYNQDGRKVAVTLSLGSSVQQYNYANIHVMEVQGGRGQERTKEKKIFEKTVNRKLPKFEGEKPINL